MRVKDKSEKAGLKLNIKRAKIMLSGLIILWHIHGEKVEAVIDFFSLVPKSLWMVTAAIVLKDTCCLQGKLQQT